MAVLPLTRCAAYSELFLKGFPGLTDDPKPEKTKHDRHYRNSARLFVIDAFKLVCESISSRKPIPDLQPASRKDCAVPYDGLQDVVP